MILPHGDQFRATLPDVPPLSASGPTMKHALKNIGDVMAGHMKELLKNGKKLPTANAVSSQIGITVNGLEAFNFWHPTVDHIGDVLE
ncbi:MAG: hypothetical protein JNM27_13685 [Leptospirales bacterium]|nr:hypothetical protein [Leptospirales bacterium]